MRTRWRPMMPLSLEYCNNTRPPITANWLYHAAVRVTLPALVSHVTKSLRLLPTQKSPPKNTVRKPVMQAYVVHVLPSPTRKIDKTRQFGRDRVDSTRQMREASGMCSVCRYLQRIENMYKQRSATTRTAYANGRQNIKSLHTCMI
jgi:hypothetical protein